MYNAYIISDNYAAHLFSMKSTFPFLGIISITVEEIKDAFNEQGLLYSQQLVYNRLYPLNNKLQKYFINEIFFSI